MSRRIITDSMAKEMAALHAAKWTYTDISQKYGVSYMTAYQTIARIINPCGVCRYRKNIASTKYCDYLLETGHRRPCPPGAECTVMRPKARDRHNKKEREAISA